MGIRSRKLKNVNQIHSRKLNLCQTLSSTSAMLSTGSTTPGLTSDSDAPSVPAFVLRCIKCNRVTTKASELNNHCDCCSRVT